MDALGVVPSLCDVILTTGSAWAVEGTLTGDLWQAGDALNLVFSDGTVWSATLSQVDGSAVWSKTNAEVAALIMANPATVQMRYVAANGNTYIWSEGRVQII